MSCPSAENCFAVAGNKDTKGYPPLVERWDGRRWSVQHVPMHQNTSQGSLMGISCASPVACMAVGSVSGRESTKLLVERWNGRRWSVGIAAPLPSGASLGWLQGVSCVSADACVAVGVGATDSQRFVLLVQRWNGRRWSAQSIPYPGGGGLNAVSCSSVVTCTAVGTTTDGQAIIAARWDGHRWSIEHTPDPGGTRNAAQNSLSGISCPSARECTAVGSYSVRGNFNAVVEHWNGRKWSVQVTPRFGTLSQLNGVSCASARSCTAVGFYDSQNGRSQQPLAEHS